MADWTYSAICLVGTFWTCRRRAKKSTMHLRSSDWLEFRRVPPPTKAELDPLLISGAFVFKQ